MFKSKLVSQVAVMAALCVMFAGVATAATLEVTNVSVVHEETGQGGTRMILEYDLEGSELAVATPTYVFIRYSADGGVTWNLVQRHLLNGDHDLVFSSGHKNVWWWGAGEMKVQNLDALKVEVRAIQMVRILGGTYNRMTEAGGGFARVVVSDTPDVGDYYIAKYETTNAQYADYLNEMSKDGRGYNMRMGSESRGGIKREGEAGAYTYTMIAGKEDHPVTYTSWYDAMDFMGWCGMRLPTEEEWEKAYRGGLYLDGDDKKRKENPLPERKYPWGDEAGDADGVFRCNLSGDKDGHASTAPVGSFGEYNSPYGVADMTGNAIEWTFNWYETPYHQDLDGYRMVRGGSWRSSAKSYSAITGATQLPLNEDSLMGFRVAR